MAICAICHDERVPADVEFEGRQVHGYHVGEIERNCRRKDDSKFKAPDSPVLSASSVDGKGVTEMAVRRNDFNDTEFRRLYNQGLNDRLIGIEWGKIHGGKAVSSSTILYWRRKLGLSKHGSTGRPGKEGVRSGARQDPAEVAPASPPQATRIEVSAGVLDLIWSGWAVQTKARAIEEYLSRTR